MTKYHLSKDGNPRVCKAEKSCPLGDLPHVELSTMDDARSWADDELRKQYGTTTIGLSKKFRKDQAVDGFDSADEKVAAHGALIKQGLRAGDSLLSEKMIREHLAYYTAMAERDELSGAIIKLAGRFDSARRGRAISSGTKWAERALDAQLKAEAFSRALAVRQAMDSMDPRTKAIAIEELRSLVSVSEFASEANTDYSDTL